MRVQQYRGLLAILILVLLMACSESAVQPTIGIALSAERVTLQTSEVKEFTATVTGTEEDAVIWSATGGSITGEGKTILYGAPDTAGEFILTATSSVDTSKSAEVIITVISNEGPDDEPGDDKPDDNQPGDDDKPDDEDPDDETPLDITVSLTPASATLGYGQTITLTATVTGTDNLAVNWQASCGVVTGNSTIGTFTAPQITTTCTITVVSMADESKQSQSVFEIMEPETVLWLTRIDAKVFNTPRRIVTDDLDNVYLLGDGYDTDYRGPIEEDRDEDDIIWEANYESFITSYDDGGNERFFKVLQGKGKPRDFVRHPDGTFYVISAEGQRWESAQILAKYDSNVNLIWEQSIVPSEFIALDSAGNIYLAGEKTVGPGYQGSYTKFALLAKYDPDGKRLWVKEMHEYESATSLAVASAGDVYVAGKGGYDDVFLARYDTNGVQEWQHLIQTSSYGAPIIVADNRDNVYIAFSSSEKLIDDPNLNPYGEKITTAKYDATGKRLWIHQFTSSLFDFTNAITTDRQGRVYVGGEYGNWRNGSGDAFLATYSASGELLRLNKNLVGAFYNESGDFSDQDHRSAIKDFVVTESGKLLITGEFMTLGWIIGDSARSTRAFTGRFIP